MDAQGLLKSPCRLTIMHGDKLMVLWIPAFAGMTRGRTFLGLPHNVMFPTIVIPAKAGIQNNGAYF